MKVKTGHRAAVSFFSILFLTCALIPLVTFAQNREGYVVEGESLDNILIGKSTMDDVVAIYGNDYKLIKHREYSYEMVYKNLGVSFYSCQADPNREIFSIYFQAPFRATTAQGIVLGKSSLADVFKIFGKANRSYEFEGIAFFADETDYEEKIAKSEQEESKAKTETLPVKLNPPNPLVIDGQEVVIDGLEISETRTGGSNLLQKTEKTSDAENDEEESSKTELEKSKPVKRIQLFEKARIPRQCHVKFRK